INFGIIIRTRQNVFLRKRSLDSSSDELAKVLRPEHMLRDTFLTTSTDKRRLCGNRFFRNENSPTRVRVPQRGDSLRPAFTIPNITFRSSRTVKQPQRCIVLTSERVNIHVTGFNVFFPVTDTSQSLFPKTAQNLGLISTSI